jgi:acyl dehydratase
VTQASNGASTATPQNIRNFIGKRLGSSDWYLIDQSRIDGFAKVTDDPDPMHIDPAWCEAHSPYEKPVAFGFLTLSMLTRLSHEVISRSVESHANGGDGYQLNYGLDKVRFIEPVPVDSRIRCHMDLIEVTERRPEEVLSRFAVEIEIEGFSRPAVVCEWLGLWVQTQGHQRIMEKLRNSANENVA